MTFLRILWEGFFDFVMGAAIFAWVGYSIAAAIFLLTDRKPPAPRKDGE